MEKMPWQPHIDEPPAPERVRATIAGANWRDGLPLLAGATIVLRELRTSDAASLLTMLSSEEVFRFISPPPATLEGFERFIAWSHLQRSAGRYICFAVVPAGSDAAIGLFQVRSLEPGFSTAEWGFAIGAAFWGSGIFLEGAQLVLDFAFGTVGVHRMEARAAVINGRGCAALRKLGAVLEGVLRQSFLRRGEYLDQSLWAILREDWRDARTTSRRGPTAKLLM